MTEGTATLPTARLGRTEIVTSCIGMGAWGFADASAAQARVGDDQTLIEVLHAAFAAGIRYIDSADAYECEDRLGRLLKEVSAPDDLLIVTKFGHGKGFAADQVRRSAEKSLERLDLEKLPLMLIHDPRDSDDMKTILGPGGALEGLRALQDEGLVGSIGVATGTLIPLQEAVACNEFDVIQMPRMHTLLNQTARDVGLLDAAAKADIGCLMAAPFGGNILATGAVRGAMYCYRPVHVDVLDAVEAMEKVCAERGVPIAQAALAYPLAEPGITATVVGLNSPQQVREAVDAVELASDREFLEALAVVGAIDTRLIGGPLFKNSRPTI